MKLCIASFVKFACIKVRYKMLMTEVPLLLW